MVPNVHLLKCCFTSTETVRLLETGTSTETIRLIRDVEKRVCEWGGWGWGGMEVVEEGDYTPVATLSPSQSSGAV